MDLAWYAVRRLTAMSPAEVAHRARQQVRKAVWRRRPESSTPVVVPTRKFTATAPRLDELAIDPLAIEALVAYAGEILRGSLDVLGIRRDDLEDPDWFLDPITGRRAPRDADAFRIATRDPTRVGTIKQVWELSRHQHLTVLAAAYWCTGDDEYARRVQQHLRSWWADNPFLTGVHWTSGIELGVRLVSWAWIRRLLDGWPPVSALFESNPTFIDQLGDHQRYLASFVSVGSSANNHVIAEAAGQLVAATAFPWFEDSRRWQAAALQLLERELTRQTFASGLNRELATDYHGFVLELALVAAAELALGGQDVPTGIAEHIVRMTDALATIVDGELAPPRQGDSDDGVGLVIDRPGAGRCASLLATGARTFGCRAWWPEIPLPDVRAGLLSAAMSGHFPPAEARPAVRAAVLADAGVVLIRAASGPDELWCRGDVGPHGFTSIAAHAHADALSFELRIGGTEVFSDPGTFCYHGAPAWRQYFRGTLGHSTLQVDGRDQSESGGPFLWTRHARTQLLATTGLEDGPVARWVAEHDGYSRRHAPLTHRRTMELHREEGRLVILDQLIGPGRHGACLSFHLGPAVCCELDASVASLRWAARPTGAVFQLDSRLEWSVHRGEESPPLGWYSPGFGQRLPATTLVGRGAIEESDELRCELSLVRASGPIAG